LGNRAAKRLLALEDIKRAGGLSRFEEKMLGLAQDQLENDEGTAAIAGYILYHLAEAVGISD
jgi:hypothetical protein